MSDTQAEQTHSATRSSPRAILATLLMVSIMATSVAVAAGADGPVLLAGGLSTALFVLLRAHSIPGNVWRTGGAMLVIAAVVLGFAEDPQAVAERGLRTTVAFLSIISAVSLLGARAEASQSVRAVGKKLGAAARQGRYGPVAYLSQLMAGGLSLAGITVLSSAVAGDLGEDGSEAQKRLAFSAILRGFCGAIAWTPMMGNMALMLAIYGLDWPQILPLNLSMSLAMVTLSVLFEASRRDRIKRGPLPEGFAAMAARLFLVLTLVVPVMLGATALLGLPVSGIIVLLSSFAAMLWAWVEGHPRDVAPPLLVLRDARDRFPGFASEALLFLGAGLASSAVAGVIPTDVAAIAGGLMLGSAGLFFLFCVTVIGGTAIAGLHPALVALLLAHTLPPATTGIDPQAHFAGLMLAWGLTTTVGPFTIIGLMLSRIIGRSSTTVTVGWNLGLVLAIAPATALLLELLARLRLALL
ncbi:hypothetical protein [Pseudooceanicola sp.]|uniref:hypothetical protein n=1 Tax=Pseudooceanicola sp. TaxID=1914328 RepID=UPI0026352097|nr:hypothetical protein [Pseudooceanicola sp.]MDF1855310.1 hypothetical protein [Pseudooceanicola sp.]